MSNDVDELRRQVAELTERVRRLEQAQANPIPRVEQQASVPVIAAAAAEPQRKGSLERRIGSQIFNRVGILAVLIGMAWFLKFAIDNHWIGPLGRVLVGLIAGVGLVVWSERFRSKGYPAFAYSLKAIGSGILYLSLWAAFELYHLIPYGVAFVGMALVTAWNGFLCWVQDAELLAFYAIVGGFITPLLLSTGENNQFILFSYLLLLDVAVLVLIALRPWSRLLFGAFAGTVFYSVAWYFRFYNDSQFWQTAFFVALFFLLFAVAPKMRAAGGAAMPDDIMLVALPLVNAAFGFLEFYSLLEEPGRRWAQPGMAVVFAAFYFMLLWVPERQGTQGRHDILSSVHRAIAVVFLTIAVPLELQGRWITIGWLVEGAALMWLARRLHLLSLRVLAICALLLGFFALIVENPAASAMVVFNERFAAYLAGIAAFAFSAWIAAKAASEDKPGDVLPWRAIAGGAVIAVNALIMIAVCLEIHSYWRFQLPPGQVWPLSRLNEYRMYEQFSYSAWTMLFGAALLAVGFWKKTAFLRWQALVLITVSIGKVFIVDTRQLSQGYRILSFLGLGALLLTVSFAYQRDWLNLRKQQKSE